MVQETIYTVTSHVHRDENDSGDNVANSDNNNVILG